MTFRNASASERTIRRAASGNTTKIKGVINANYLVGADAVTFALRLSFIALLGQIEIPLLLGRALRFVPAAVLTAVVIPLLFYDNSALEVSLGNERLLAGLVGVLIAWRTRSVLFTLGGGMATLWTLQAIGQSL